MSGGLFLKASGELHLKAIIDKKFPASNPPISSFTFCCLSCILARMPRKPRIDEPGLIFHVIARGIERRLIFNGESDCAVFLERLGRLASDTDTRVFAFALLPNHIHVLLRRRDTPVSTFMQRLLTGHAVFFNKKYRRSGHLFQNRYKSILCRSDLHFLELVRYIHLNPLRAGLLDSMEQLEGYPYSGHRFLVGRDPKIVTDAWFDPSLVLMHFGSSMQEARQAYLTFVKGGLAGDAGVAACAGPDFSASDLHVGGSVQKPDESAQNQDSKSTGTSVKPVSKIDVEFLVSEVCLNCSVTLDEIRSATRRRCVTRARAVLAFRMSKEIGMTGSDIGRRLSVTRSAVSKMIANGGEICALGQESMKAARLSDLEQPGTPHLAAH